MLIGKQGEPATPLQRHFRDIESPRKSWGHASGRASRTPPGMRSNGIRGSLAPRGGAEGVLSRGARWAENPFSPL